MTETTQALWDNEDAIQYRERVRQASTRVLDADTHIQELRTAWREAARSLAAAEAAVTNWTLTLEPIPPRIFLERVCALQAEVERAEEELRRMKGELTAGRAKRGRLWDERRVAIRAKYERFPLEEWAAQQQVNAHAAEAALETARVPAEQLAEALEEKTPAELPDPAWWKPLSPFQRHALRVRNLWTPEALAEMLRSMHAAAFPQEDRDAFWRAIDYCSDEEETAPPTAHLELTEDQIKNRSLACIGLLVTLGEFFLDREQQYLRVVWDEPCGIFEASSLGTFGDWHMPDVEQPRPTKEEVATAVSAALGVGVAVTDVVISPGGKVVFSFQRARKHPPVHPDEAAADDVLPWPGGLTETALDKASIMNRFEKPLSKPLSVPAFEWEGRLWVCTSRLHDDASVTAAICPLIPRKEFVERYPGIAPKLQPCLPADAAAEDRLQYYTGVRIKVGRKEYAVAPASETRRLLCRKNTSNPT